ncbi:MAG: hypothetical protein K2L47_00485, partial [Clostridia bacterium]|nr:hypothetical protein [Clostridia bacterium]
MAKGIKRAGIVVFALVISCLLLLGMTMTVRVTDSNDEVSLAVDTKENNELTNTPITEYVLKGSCKEMGDLWNKAVQESIDTEKQVKVVLGNDWNAVFDEDIGGSTFYAGADLIVNYIRVPVGSRVVMDLNGYDLNKGLKGTEGEGDGFIIRIWGTLDLIDNKYNYDDIMDIYNKYGANETQFLTALRNTDMGKLTGAVRSANSGGAVIVDGGTFNMYGGLLIDNSAKVGGAGIAYNVGGTTTIYDGVIANNTSTYGAGFAGANLTIHRALICYNKATNYGGGINGNNVKIYGGMVVRNSAGNYGGGITLSGNENIIGNAIVGYNTAVNHSGGIYFPTGANLTINAGANVYNNKLTSN